MTKKQKTNQPDWVRTLRDFVATLQTMNNNREKANSLLVKLEREYTTEAAKFQTLSPERKLSLQLGLAILPMKSATSVLQMANGQVSDPHTEKVAPRAATRQEATTT